MRASCASLSQQYAEVLAVAADDVLVAHNLLEHAASLVTALARLHVRNLARRSSLEADSTREKKGGEERINVKNSVWQFYTGHKKCQWRERVYPERGSQVVVSLQPVWAESVAKYWFWPRA
jgi:hypothetical protein